MTPVSVRLFFQQLTCVMFFSFEKLLLSVNSIFGDISYDVIAT